MNEQLSHPFISDAAFRDAEKRVLGSILTQFEELSDDDLEELVKTNVDFFGNDHIRKIIGTTYKKEIGPVEYTIGSSNFNCKDAGINIVVFRGANRNRRRGFHNTWVFYHKILSRVRK